VAYGWRQEQVAENAKEISALGSEIHERLRVFVEHFGRVGYSLDRAVESYNKAAGTLESRILVTARRIKERGATSAPDLISPEPVERASRPVVNEL